MGKAERNRQERARANIAAQRAAAKRAEARRKLLIAGGAMLSVIAVVVAFVVVKALQGTPAAAASGPAKTDATVERLITHVPASVLDSVGRGPTGTTAVTPPKAISGEPVLTSGGKPEVLYIGAEYCPFCAAERWSMAVALSRFGTFSGLHFIHSSSTDVYASTPTLTFYKSTYTSPYVAFVPVETTTVDKKTLQTPTSAEQALETKYDSGYIPFVDIGNRYVVSNAQYQPPVLGSVYGPSVVSPNSLSWTQIGQDLQHPGNSVAQSVLGAANYLTATICKMTHGQPGSVCSSAAITKLGGNI